MVAHPWTLGAALAACGLAGAQQEQATRAAPDVVRGRFVSRQVNVDVGRDVVGDAANEPSLALDPRDPDRIVVGWRQMADRTQMEREGGYAYSHDAGRSWTVGVLAPDELVSDPVVRADDRGRFYYLGLGRNLRLWRSDDGGASWLPPVTVRGARDKPWLAIHGDVLAVAWEGMTPRSLAWSDDRGATFAAPIAVPRGPTYGTLAFDDRGMLYLVGRERADPSAFVLARVAPGEPPRVAAFSLGGSMVFDGAPNPGGLLGQVQVVVDPVREDHVYVLCSVDPEGPDPADVHLVRSTDGGASFGAPVRVNPDPPAARAWQWFGTLAVAPDGRLDVVWNDTGEGGEAFWTETVHSCSDDGGLTWSPPTRLTPRWDSHQGQPVQRKVGDYYDLVSTATAAHLAYAATFRGSQDVYYLRIARE